MFYQWPFVQNIHDQSKILTVLTFLCITMVTIQCYHFTGSLEARFCLPALSLITIFFNKRWWLWCKTNGLIYYTLSKLQPSNYRRLILLWKFNNQILNYMDYPASVYCDQFRFLTKRNGRSITNVLDLCYDYLFTK